MGQKILKIATQRGTQIRENATKSGTANATNSGTQQVGQQLEENASTSGAERLCDSHRKTIVCQRFH